MKTRTTTADRDVVLRLLRLLPPRERLRVIAQILPELEHELACNSVSADFWSVASMRTLAEQQSVQPAEDFTALAGGWPEDESIDDFLSAIHEWRQRNLAEVGPE